jgi:pyruvate dehydrogenase E2 component (dihydrolipoamide acetyltransferase)
MEQIIKVPDIGTNAKVDVIEILVKVGDKIEIDTPLVTLESDKASMEIPSSESGIVKSIQVKIGDKVEIGDVILHLEAEEPAVKIIKQNEEPAKPVSESQPQQTSASGHSLQTFYIPDIGSTASVDVIEIFVKVGDVVDIDTPLLTLESEKASMEIPCSIKGTIQYIMVKLGDKVKTGDAVLTILGDSTSEAPVTTTAQASVSTIQTDEIPQINKTSMPITSSESTDTMILAGPAARRLARALGVSLTEIKGSGKKDRITLEDIEQHVRQRMQQPTSSSASPFLLPVTESIDFSKFGEIENQSLSKIKRLSGKNLHRAWLQIPHVTQFDEADITELEAFRKEQGTVLEKEGVKLTILAFICKAVARALQEFPDFNASLTTDGQSLIYKKYINIGIAVDTPAGLVVPVIKTADQLSIRELAIKMGELSQKARQKSLTPADMSGGTFTISSLGGIGGNAFTPIVNHPEVAILGVSKSSIEPVYINNQFVPRLILPLSLSYDHRVIDGAQGARFTKFLSSLLSDIRKIML